MNNALAGNKILVTGATGFIGGRLVEKLVTEWNATVRVMVRSSARALNIARYPVELVYGDINELTDSVRAAEECSIVIHCAYGNSGDEQSRRAANVGGTQNVLEAARRARVKRFVHLSTVQVYGPLSDGDVDESRPRRHFGHGYSDSKLDAENIALDYFRNYGLPVVILQPTVVYGPNSLIWTIGLLCGLTRERHILVDNGEGYCNAVYVDDVADAIVLASVREQAVGESFLVSAEQPTTWREFYHSYERMLGISGTVPMSAAEAKAYEVHGKQRERSIFKEALAVFREEPSVRARLLNTREVHALMRVGQAVIPADIRDGIKRRIKGENLADVSGLSAAVEQRPIRPLSFPLDVAYYKARARVRIDKAKRLLGYQPAFDLGAGMARTEQWARWSNLIDDHSAVCR